MDSRPLLFETIHKDLTCTYGQIHSLSACISAPVLLDSSYVAACSLLESITKKFVPKDPVLLDQTRRAAFATFTNMNERQYPLDRAHLLINEMRRIAESDFPVIKTWRDLLDRSGLIVGAGSSVLSRGQNSCFEKFFVNDLSTTNPWLYCEYLHYIQEHASFHDAERMRRHHKGCAFKLVDGSTLTTVPKNDRTDRMICTEPSLNMIFQRSLGVAIDDVLRRRLGYDSSVQPDRNRALARLGSITGSVSTIDLTSASDTISRSLISQILPSWVNIAIDDCRCQYTSYEGNLIELNMLSTMGNGFTFPMQTYVFSLMLRALFKDVHFEKSHWGVFGDDLVVPTKFYKETIAALESLGFIPNLSKSFNTGFFRESCGTDWYNGTNVRGVYCKKLDTINDRFSLVNRLIRFSARHAILLKNTCCTFSDIGWTRFAIPSDLSDDSGLKTPRPPLGSFKHGTFRYRYFSPKRELFQCWKGDQLISSHLNPLGIMIAAVVSSVSDGLDRRSRHTRYVISRGYTPVWRYPDRNEWESNILLDWETAFAENLDSKF